MSRHETSEGTVVYTRCVCGRLQVRHGDAAAPVLSSRAGSLGSRGRSVMRRLLGNLALLAAAALVMLAAVRLPTAALLACAALFVVVAMLGWAWAWLTGPEGTRPLRFALRAGAVGAGLGMALSGMTVVLQSATVVALPVVCLAGGVWFWRTRLTAPRACF
ncbi:MAG: hypothetical protein J2P20_10640 [Pseudonocardia sp.]|nr:hypothetical protein [Pseudonocardia sp.]MBO0878584.1 hypothetical protein [Pseudonocardia sp.]